MNIDYLNTLVFLTRQSYSKPRFHFGMYRQTFCQPYQFSSKDFNYFDIGASTVKSRYYQINEDLYVDLGGITGAKIPTNWEVSEKLSDERPTKAGSCPDQLGRVSKNVIPKVSNKQIGFPTASPKCPTKARRCQLIRILSPTNLLGFPTGYVFVSEFQVRCA